MAEQTYEKAQACTFTGVTGLTEIELHNISMRVARTNQEVTGVQSGGSADTLRRFLSHLPVTDVVLSGSVKYASGPTFSKAVTSIATMATFGTKIRLYDWMIARRWELFDVTSSGEGATDSEKDWMWGLPLTYGWIRGWLSGSGAPGYATAQETALTLDLDLVGDFAGNAFIDGMQTNADIRRGGPIPCAFGYRYGIELSGTTYTYVKDTSDYDAIFKETTTDCPGGALTFQWGGTGETVSAQNVRVYNIQMRNDHRHGGEINVSMTCRFDKG